MFFCPEILQEVCNYSASSLILLLLWENVGAQGGIGNRESEEGRDPIFPAPLHSFLSRMEQVYGVSPVGGGVFPDKLC